jgi:DNA-binding NtrC family response regulator
VHFADGARIVPLSQGRPVTLGRGDEVTLSLDDRSLSREHARFELRDEGVIVTDLGSTNGTWVGAERAASAVVVPAGAEVRLGAVTVAVHSVALGRPDGRRLLGYDTFRGVVETELTRARFFRRSAALLMVRGGGDSRALRAALPRLEELLRPVDSAAFYTDSRLLVLAPELDLTEGEALARALAGTPRGQGLTVGVAAFPRTATSTEEIFDAARAALQRATEVSPVSVAESLAARTESKDARRSAPVCESPVMKELYKSAAKIARSALPVLLLAETGAGKEVLARYLHDASPRRSEPLVSVNCAAIPESLIESTLFGHERGAFTGATAQHLGVFEAASRGTVFLDELGELPPAAQAALLRVLEARTIQRVGSTKEIAVDVRVVAATHRDLGAMVAAGAFRQDLLYRLNTMTLEIPPLRDRPEEIPLLAERFLAQANHANQSALRGFSEEAMNLLRAYEWPGNIRELRNVIERAAVVAEGEYVDVLDLPASLVRAAPARATAPALDAPPVAASPPARAELDPGEDVDFKTKMDRLEAQVLLDALDRCGGNQTRAARYLSMPLRTLVHKIKVHNLRRPGFTREEP